MVEERKIPAGYKNTEVGVIPEEWEVKRLKELAFMKSGQSITSRKIKELDVYPCFGGNGLRGYTSNYTHNGEFVLIGRQGALCGNIQYVGGAFFASEHAVVVTANSKTNIKWLSYILTDMNLNQYSESSAQPGLSVLKISELKVITPSEVNEQQAIAEALGDMDDLVESVEKLIDKKQKIKEGAMQELLTGKRRLPGFTGEWRSKGFEDIFVKVPTKEYQVSTMEYLESGNYPIVDQGKIKVIAYTNNNNKLFKCPEEGIIVFGDHTREFKYITFNFVVGADGVQLLTVRDGNSILYLYYSLLNKGVPDTGYNRHFKFLRKMIFAAPPLREQMAIAQVLSDMDSEIEAIEKKLNKYRAIKQGMMQELLTGRIRLI